MGADLEGVLAEQRFAPGAGANPARPAVDTDSIDTDIDTDIDIARMVRRRHARLQAEMANQDVEVAILLHRPHVTYATGHPVHGVDATHAVWERPVAVVTAGGDRSHLLAGDIESQPATPPEVQRHPAVWPELGSAMPALADALAAIAGPLAGRRVALDEQTGAMLRAGLLDGATVVDASHLVASAKIVKTADELACIALAQRRNEIAMRAAQQALRPGVRRSTVAGAFLSALHEALHEPGGANLIDPIFQPVPRSVTDGPRTTTGTVAFPTGVGDPVFAEGDLVWVDSGIDHLGYASDFGRTWVVGRDPTPAEQSLFSRWCAVMTAVLDVLRPGVTAGDLCHAATTANDGERPWLPYFYLAHGVGIESAEMPLVGTDLGAAFDDGLVLAPGMVLVLEPVVWREGVGGYRAEEIVAVTDDGWCHLGGGYPYAPFEAAA
jgi:Xaa-Pro dipeptidase